MAVLMIIQTIEVPNPEMYKEYTSKARPIIESFGGVYIVSTADITEISKNWRPEKVTVIQFPDRKSFEDCFASEEYKSIVHLRLNSAVVGKAIAVDTL